MVRPNPFKLIDSWEDLYNNNNIEIIAPEGTPIYNYAYDSDSEQAKNFKSRMKSFSFEILADYEFQESLLLNLSKGQSAYVGSRYHVIVALISIAKKHNKTDLINKIHISNDGGGYLATFLEFSSLIDVENRQILNTL